MRRTDRGQAGTNTVSMGLTVIIIAVMGIMMVDIMGQVNPVLEATLTSGGPAGSESTAGEEFAEGFGMIFDLMVPMLLIFVVVNIMAMVLRFSSGDKRPATSSASASNDSKPEPEPEPDPVDVAKERYLEGETTLRQFENEVYDAIEVDIPEAEPIVIEQTGPIPAEGHDRDVNPGFGGRRPYRTRPPLPEDFRSS